VWYATTLIRALARSGYRGGRLALPSLMIRTLKLLTHSRTVKSGKPDTALKQLIGDRTLKMRSYSQQAIARKSAQPLKLVFEERETKTALIRSF
jgi:hypothetical protein